MNNLRDYHRSLNQEGLDLEGLCRGKLPLLILPMVNKVIANAGILSLDFCIIKTDNFGKCS